MDEVFRNCLILTGPTGSGKSALALELAPRLNAEIVAMDSMTLYRGMDIGTAKPTADERARVRHHLIDMLEPWQPASVAWWLGRAAACVREIEGRGKTALFVGGTALYLKALLCGLFDGPPADVALRERLAAVAAREGNEALHARLAAVDAATAARLHPNDTRRVIRALEVYELTGRPMGEWQTQWRTTPPAPCCGAGVPPAAGTCRRDACTTTGEGAGGEGLARCLCLDLPRPLLYQRIDARVERMFADGLLDEVRRLRRLECPLSKEAGQALGYKELFDHLDGRASLAEAIARVQTRSRNFAKRQLTWFRRLAGCQMASEELTRGLWASRMSGGDG